MSVVDLTAAIDRETEREERAADLDSRDREHGGMRSLSVELEEEERARSMIGWRDRYRAEVSWREVAAAKRGEPADDPRRVSAARISRDIARAANRWAKKIPRDDRELLANDALALILSWPSQGLPPNRIDLGGLHAERAARIAARREPTAARAALRYLSEIERMRDRGSLPLRRDWINPEKRDRDGSPMCSDLALKALRAAINQASETRYWRAERSRGAIEEPSGLDLTAELDEEEAREIEPLRVPNLAAAEVIAELMALPLDGARAIIVAHEKGAHVSGALRAQWNLSPSAYSTAIERGSRIVRERYPDPDKLLAEIETLPERYRDLAERGAILALGDLKHGWIEEPTARAAVAEYRAAIGTMPERDRAILSAARRALMRESLRSLPMWPDASEIIRARAAYGSEIAERIALSAARLVPAEMRRIKRGGLIRSDLAPNYPEPELRRRKLRRAAVIALSDAASELASALDSGSPRAERIAALRALIREIGSGGERGSALALRRILAAEPTYEARHQEPAEPSESPSAIDALAALRSASGSAPIVARRELSESQERAVRRALRPVPSAMLSGEIPAEPQRDGWGFIRSGYEPRRYWGSPNHPMGRIDRDSAVARCAGS